MSTGLAALRSESQCLDEDDPLRHVDVVEAVGRLAVAVAADRHLAHRGARQGVT